MSDCPSCEMIAELKAASEPESEDDETDDGSWEFAPFGPFG